MLNLTSLDFSHSDLSFLNKGLGFIPSLDSDRVQLDVDMQRFYRSLRIKTHLAVDRPDWANKNSVSNPSLFFSRTNHLKPASRFIPPRHHIELETFIKKVQRDLDGLPAPPPVRNRFLPSLQKLAKNKSIIIKKADKGSSIVLQDRNAYRQEILGQLGDVTTYKPLPSDPLPDLLRELKSILDHGLNDGIISKNQYDFLLPEFPVTPVLYTLPKVHKSLSNPPGRPIVSGTNSIFQSSAVFLDCLLRPFSTQGQSYVKDTTHFLKFIHDLILPHDCLLVTLDIKSLYTSIPQAMGIQAIQNCITHSTYSVSEQQFIITLLEFVLSKNYFLFEDSFHQQISGTAMGCNVAPSFAVIFINSLETNFVYPHHLFKHAKLYLRYIDDIFMVWDDTPESLNEFVIFLNNITPTIQFSCESSTVSINFLDVKVYSSMGKLETDLFVKPTDRNSILHFNSQHPLHVLKSIPFSQFLRVKRIVSDPQLVTVRLNEMVLKFLKRGYPNYLLKQHLSRIEQISRESLLVSSPESTTKRKTKDRVPFVSNFSVFSKPLKQIITKHWHILSDSFPETFGNRPLFSYRRGKTFSQFLTRSDIGSNKTSIQSLISDSPVSGTFPCLGCAQCNSVTKGPYFTHPLTGQRFKIPGHFSCLSSFVIYFIKCPCGIGYIGKTTQQIRDRISQHKSTIRTKKLGLPLPDHFLSNNHHVYQLKFQVIDWVPKSRRGGDRGLALTKKELFWIRKLGTLHPHGLNREYEPI